MEISSDLLNSYDKLKLDRTIQAIFMRPDAALGKIISVQEFAPSVPYEDIINQLPSDEPLYLIFDFSYETDEKPPRKTNRILGVSWTPTTAPFRKKTLLKSSEILITEILTGIQRKFIASEKDDLEISLVRKELLKN